MTLTLLVTSFPNGDHFSLFNDQGQRVYTTRIHSALLNWLSRRGYTCEQ